MSKDLREKIFPLSYEQNDWDICRAEWKGKYYNHDPSQCVCGVRIVEKYLIRNEITKCEVIVGNVCIKQFTELLKWAESEKKMKECYSVTGKFEKRNYGKNNYKVRKNTKLTKLLFDLQSKGYKVPMYGYKYAYICVTESAVREAMEDYKLDLKLVEYDYSNKGIVLKSLSTTTNSPVTKKRKREKPSCV